MTKNIFQIKPRTRSVPQTNFPNLTDLDMPFLKEEVWNTIKNLHANKAFGPDGFTCHFYKMCWNIIKG
jgi:hypothetical protein